MNRRTFLSTITTLTGIVLADTNAPTQAKDYLRHTASGTFKRGDPLHFIQNHVYIQGKHGLYKWEPTPIQRRLLGYPPIDKP